MGTGGIRRGFRFVFVVVVFIFAVLFRLSERVGVDEAEAEVAQAVG